MESIDRIAAKAYRAGLALRSPAPLSAIERFETQTSLRLPDPYRHFLLYVANGGMEPCRLTPIERWSDAYWLDEPRPALVAAPCLLTPETAQAGERWLEGLHVPAWESRWDQGAWSPMCGTIAVAEIGCGLFFSMVMNGQHRGRIFSWGDHASQPPLFVPETNFGAWLESHLDLILAGHPVHFLNGRV
jgi:hypothetical protein